VFVDSDDIPLKLTAKQFQDRAKQFRKLADAATTASLKERLFAVADECERAASARRSLMTPSVP
jgi:hypothetical protein